MPRAPGAVPLPSTTRLRQGQGSLYFPRRVVLTANRKSILIDNLRNLSMTLPGNTHLRDKLKDTPLNAGKLEVHRAEKTLPFRKSFCFPGH